MNELMRKRLENQERLVKLMDEYTRKYIKKILNYVEDTYSSDVLKEFQKILAEIAKWNDTKKDKEYNKFLKWSLKKYNMDESSLQDILDNIILYSVKLIVNKYDINTLMKLIEYNNIELLDFVYKCIKRIARHYYDNPNEIKMRERNDEKTKDMITLIIYKCIPIDKIVKLIEEQVIEEDEHDTKSEVEYDFNKTFTDTDENCNNKLVIEKEQDEDVKERNGLKYIPSDELYNEYYKSDKSEKSGSEILELQKKTFTDTKETRESQEKHIAVPKLKMNYKQYNREINKKKKNFFD
jgi:hypothetical protein